MTAMLKSADPKLIARSCVAHVLAEGEEAACAGETFEALGVLEFRSMKRKLLSEMIEFARNVSTAREAETTIVRVKEASQSVLCLPCDDNDAEMSPDEAPEAAAAVEAAEDTATDAAEAATNAMLLAGEEEMIHEPSLDDFLQKLSLSLAATRSLGWVNATTHDVLQRHMSSVAAFDFVDGVKAWPPDVVAAIACCKALSKFPHGNIKTALKKLAKQHGLKMVTISQALDALPPLPLPSTRA
jgi:hypothetical protein